MKFPTEVFLDEKGIYKLIATYKKAYEEIVQEMEKTTDFGIRNRKAILSQVTEILDGFGQEVNGYIDADIRKQYQSGSNDAILQLKYLDAPISVSSKFNNIHKDAIASLVDDTQKAFAESVQGVGRSAYRMLGKAVRERMTERLAVGKIGGKALRSIKNDLVGVLRSEGLESLVDKGGKRWTLDRYSEMLIRTKSVEARNRGLLNRMVENGYDLVQVSAHGADDVCGPWEGKILSITGDTKGYPTVREAEKSGLFHPNCKHAINTLVPSLAKFTKAYNPNVDTLTGKDFVDEVDEKLKGYYRPPNQVVKPKTLGA